MPLLEKFTAPTYLDVMEGAKGKEVEKERNGGEERAGKR